MVGFVPVSPALVEIYDASSLVISMCTLEYLVSFIPFNFVSISMLYKRGLRFCMVTAAILCLIGTWARTLIQVYPHFYIVFLASFPIAIA